MPLCDTLGQALEEPQWINCDVRKFDMRVLGKFGVIMTDPPWEIHQDLPYGTMADDEMRKLNIGCLQDDGVIFVWVTGSHLRCRGSHWPTLSSHAHPSHSSPHPCQRCSTPSLASEVVTLKLTSSLRLHCGLAPPPPCLARNAPPAPTAAIRTAAASASTSPPAVAASVLFSMT